MTLIVARQVDNEIYIVGDTRFSDSHLSEAARYRGGLKIVVLAPGLCVGFAGNVEFARDAIQGIYGKDVNLFDKNRTIEYFLEHHKRSIAAALETDFIIAIIAESTGQTGLFTKEIFRIANSTVSWENETAHIGESEAFKWFQQQFHQGRLSAHVPTLSISRVGNIEHPGFDRSHSTALNAIQGVIDSPRISSVDGIRTAVRSEEGQFKYCQDIVVRGSPIPISNEPNTPLSFGGVAEGSDIKQTGIFTAIGIGVFTVYWITGCVGLIYHPEESFEPSIISNCTQEEFRLRVIEKTCAAYQRAINCQSRF